MSWVIRQNTISVHARDALLHSDTLWEYDDFIDIMTVKYCGFFTSENSLGLF